MDTPPTDEELIDRALALHDVLTEMAPSPDFSAHQLESLRDVLSQVADELRGDREPHITLFRPQSLVSYLRNNFESTLQTTEGNDVYEFIRTLAYRAEALDLPRIAPENASG